MERRGRNTTGGEDRYVGEEFVTRARISQDRRVISRGATEKRRRLAENAPPPVRKNVVKGLSKMDEADRAQIVVTLNQVTVMVDVEDMDNKREAGHVWGTRF